MYKPTTEEIAEILAKHKRWLEESEGWSEGDRANLSGAYLSGANLHGANLSGANLSWADLSRADLSGANLHGANLSGADLSRADLSGANLHGANLSGADLSRAYLRDVRHGELALAMTEIVPREGSFVGWKKCRAGRIVRLRIPEGAKRSNATGRKCRASKAEVLAVYGADGSPQEEATSDYDESFTYRVGEVVEVEDFCEDRLEECAAGIHFYLTREEAENH